jgi:hypothetical protein
MNLGRRGVSNHVVAYGVPGQALEKLVVQRLPDDLKMSLYVGRLDLITFQGLGPGAIEALRLKDAMNPGLSFTILEGVGHSNRAFCAASSGVACMSGMP